MGRVIHESINRLNTRWIFVCHIIYPNLLIETCKNCVVYFSNSYVATVTVRRIFWVILSLYRDVPRLSVFPLILVNPQPGCVIAMCTKEALSRRLDMFPARKLELIRPFLL